LPTESEGKSRKIEEKENRFQLTACCCLLLVYLLIKFKAHRWQKTTLHPTIYYSLLPSKQKRRGKLQTTEKTGAKFALYLLAISRPLLGATREMSSVPPTAHSPIIRDGDGGLKGDKGHLFMRSTRHWGQLATSGDGLWQ